ncbi:MAG TPA: FAD-binding oxidoreductase [Mycobacteriales bacterium]|nr:FAD-binding oxidoreductase [Mycobacteriales bacterium]
MSADLSKLRDVLSGRVLLPGDDGYDTARALHNGAIDNHPDAIAQPVDGQEAATALRYARDRGLSVSVKGGGHGVVGHATAGEVVIDLEALRGVRIDPAGRLAVAGGGARWSDVDVPAAEHGLAVPGGRVTHTGIGGFTLGGGDGWLSTRFGLTIDNLVGVELVTADGALLSVDADSEPDLFWALRGGGGNFGIVTELRYRLHEVSVVLGGMLVFPLPLFPQVAAVMDELNAADRDEWGGAMVLLSAPDAPFVPAEAVGRPVVSVVPVWSGDIDEGMAFIAPLRALSPVVDLAAPMPYPALQGLIDQGNPDGLRNYWTSAFVKTSPAQMVEPLMEAATRFPTVLNNIIMAPIAGAITRVPLEDTAFPVREDCWFIHPIGRGTSPETDDAVRAWAKGLGATLRAHEFSTYLNTESEDGASRVKDAFSDARLDRLKKVKQTWDPDNVFRHCANIAP